MCGAENKKLMYSITQLRGKAVLVMGKEHKQGKKLIRWASDVVQRGLIK